MSISEFCLDAPDFYEYVTHNFLGIFPSYFLKNEGYFQITPFGSDSLLSVGSQHMLWNWIDFLKVALIVKPWPQTLSTKPFSPKSKTKGPWADTKLLQATHYPLTLKHEGLVLQQNSKSKNILERSHVLVHQKKIQLYSKRKDMG